MNFTKFLLSSLVVAALSASAVLAGDLSLTIGEESRLPSCGGYVTITKSPQGNRGEQVNLVFRGVQNCSNFDILSNAGASVDYSNKKLQGSDQSFTLPKRVLDLGWNNVKVVVKSNSGAHSDVIRVRFVEVPSRAPAPRPAPVPAPRPVISYSYLTLTIGQESYLPSCGGKIQVTKSPQGNNGEQVNLVFRDVQNCSNFDIVASNYEQIGYPNKKLQQGASGFNGSFTLPKSVIDYGFNNVRIVVNSNSGAHADNVTVAFTQGSSGSKGPALPSTPSNGGSW